MQSDKGRHRVTIESAEGAKHFEREFSCCDVVLGNDSNIELGDGERTFHGDPSGHYRSYVVRDVIVELRSHRTIPC